MSVAASVISSSRPVRGREQRERVRLAFGEFREELAECRRNPDHAFTVSDLDHLRAFLSAQCEERQCVRELIAAGRITFAGQPAEDRRDPIAAEWARRGANYAREYWEKALGGKTMIRGEASSLHPMVRSVTEAILRAEKAATLAVLAGARYPREALDKAWRQVLAARGEETEEASLDLLAACREAWELAMEVQVRALNYLTDLVNTGAAKGASPKGASLVVFSLSGRREVATCRARIALTGALASGFELLDEGGHPVSYQLASASRMGEANWVEIAFTSADLPCLGYSTFSLRPTDRFPEPAALRENAPVGGSVLARQTGAHGGPLPAELDLVSVDAQNVTIVAVKPVGPEVFVRVHECEGRAVNAVAAFGHGFEQVWQSDSAEGKLGELSSPRFGWRRAPRAPLELQAWDSANLLVALRPLLRTTEPLEIGPTREAYQPIYCRYWDHDLGAAPLGDLPLGVWVDGTLPLGQNTRFPLCLSNDSQDREFVGTVRVEAPEHWMLLPRQIPYRIAPGAQALYEIVVVVPEDASPCFLRFETEDGAQTVQDVLPVGEIAPLEVGLAREGDGITVSITNPNPDCVEGLVELIAPPEAWAKLTPRMQPFRVEANGSAARHFAVEGEAAQSVARVAWYGRVQYTREHD